MKVSSIGDIFFITAMLEDLQDTVKVKSFRFSNLAQTKKTKENDSLDSKKRKKKTRIFHEKIRIFSMRNIQRIQGLNLTPDIFLLQKLDFTSALAGDRV